MPLLGLPTGSNAEFIHFVVLFAKETWRQSTELWWLYHSHKAPKHSSPLWKKFKARIFHQDSSFETLVPMDFNAAYQVAHGVAALLDSLLKISVSLSICGFSIKAQLIPMRKKKLPGLDLTVRFWKFLRSDPGHGVSSSRPAKMCPLCLDGSLSLPCATLSTECLTDSSNFNLATPNCNWARC